MEQKEGARELGARVMRIAEIYDDLRMFQIGGSIRDLCEQYGVRTRDDIVDLSGELTVRMKKISPVSPHWDELSHARTYLEEKARRM
jgi:hypothetical protein